MPSPIILWQMPALWGLPNPSPFCMKVETWLRMNDIPYETRAVAGPLRSSTGKMPYIERPGGTVLEDSSRIIATLTKELGTTLDAGLDETQRATALVVQRTLEESLYFTLVWERWVNPAGWRITAPAYFASFPWLIRQFALPWIRRGVVAAVRGQGTGRMTPEHVHARGVADVQAVAAILGERAYFLGRPSSLDAIAYAFLANLLIAPYESPIREAVRAQPRLVRYIDRMRERYYGAVPGRGVSTTHAGSAEQHPSQTVSS